jgi:hypothetical protein
VKQLSTARRFIRAKLDSLDFSTRSGGIPYFRMLETRLLSSGSCCKLSSGFCFLCRLVSEKSLATEPSSFCFVSTSRAGDLDIFTLGVAENVIADI